ncbi:fimbrial protein [Utexia brackfieldae]|uniref:fimbrial protein n=1 Tax=Utexia brackfieldae TaxID=3074108 RepID=UPI00370D5D7F
MKNKRYLARYVSLLLLMFSTVTIAADPKGSGKVHLQGAIRNSTCMIDTGSTDQTIEIGKTPMAEVYKVGEGPSKFFSIKLIDCNFEKKVTQAWQGFYITFDGPAHDDAFQVFGDARGVELSLKDSRGTIITPGKPFLLNGTEDNESGLTYEIKLIANGHYLKPGYYQAIIRFKLDYY